MQKFFETFPMDQANSLFALMIGRNKIKYDAYHSCEEEEKIVAKTIYLIAFEAFTYITTYIRPNICFDTNILT